MASNDPLANALSKINNAEARSKPDVLLTPVSTIIQSCLTLMQEHGFITGTTEEEGVGKKLRVKLNGRINKCGAIKPRFMTKASELEKHEQRYLPAKDFGILVLSTSSGMITHYEAKKKGIGGRLIAYCY
ncbi:30S ribosomal protein S8 [Candidatus Woesearchaeota archaeon CG1_02_57_44]|nr:MAG: 30S ribosomal protein S8 [Candidatus Woesearchaeota archaeon CG1_02_57_44]